MDQLRRDSSHARNVLDVQHSILRSVTLATGSSASSTTVVEGADKDAKRFWAEKFALLVRDAGSHSSLHAEYSALDPGSATSWWSVFLCDMMSYDPTYLRAFHYGWQSWKRFAEQETCAANPFVPSRGLVRIFISHKWQMSRSGGRALGSHLMFVQQHAGILFGLDKDSLRQRRGGGNQTIHNVVPRQATPLEVRMIVHLEYWGASCSEFTAMLADVWAVMTLAVLRPRHAQRSRLTDIRAEGLVGTAFRGKLEVNAVYQWTLPSRGVTNCGLATRFWERWFAVMGRISPDGPIACLLPAATIPRGKGFAAATS